MTSCSFSNKVVSSPLKSKVVSTFENASENLKILDTAINTLLFNSRLTCSESTRALRPPAFAAWNFAFSFSTCRAGDSPVNGVSFQFFYLQGWRLPGEWSYQ